MQTTQDNFRTFADACRENTGAHFLDSGSAYGRHWQRQEIAENINPVAVDVHKWGAGHDITATIEAAHFLAESLDVDTEMMERFNEWQDGRDGDWFALAQDFCADELGLVSRSRDNIYNGENDLSQVYVWEVWTPEDDGGDWIFSKPDTITVIHVHTGCDVRGGYGRPIFCRSRGEYAVPVDLCAEYRCIEGRDEDGNELTDSELSALSERWTCGYSGYPSGAVRDDVARVFSHTVRGSQFIAKLNSGEVVRIAAEMPYNG
jgi:hypothetical protein